jgi:hypothetical protein
MVGYTHLLEFLPDRESQISGTFMCIDGLVYVLSPILYKNVTNDLSFFIETSAIFCALSLIFFFLIRVPESMKFLLIKGRFREFWEAYAVTQKFNKTST